MNRHAVRKIEDNIWLNDKAEDAGKKCHENGSRRLNCSPAQTCATYQLD